LLLIVEADAGAGIVAVDDRAANVAAVICCRFQGTESDNLAAKEHIFKIPAGMHQDHISIYRGIYCRLDGCVLLRAIYGYLKCNGRQG